MFLLLFYDFFHFASQDDVGSGPALGVCTCIKLPVSLWYHDFGMGCILEQWVLSCLTYYNPSPCSFHEFQVSSDLQAVLKDMSLMNESMTWGFLKPTFEQLSMYYSKFQFSFCSPPLTLMLSLTF